MTTPTPCPTWITLPTPVPIIPEIPAPTATPLPTVPPKLETNLAALTQYSPPIWEETLPTTGADVEWLWAAAFLGVIFGIAFVIWLHK